ncbi:ABC transporter permease [Massilia sp. W12]|uniref:ABC transporter permease n=1 Tax=Massilia sp. W12 TaxID=3126507 RepID=UPI0030D2D172
MYRQISTIAAFTLLEAMRNRLLWLLAIFSLCGILGAAFFHALAITENNQVQLALLAALLRVGAVFLLATFVVTSVTRELHDKVLELTLALALPRAAWVMGRLCGFWLLSLLFSTVFGAICLLYANPLQVLQWSFSLCWELCIVAAFALLTALSLSQVASALAAVLAFYLLTRSIGALQLMGQGPLAGMQDSQIYLARLLDLIAWFLPDLDRFTRAEWLLYQAPGWGGMLPLLLQTLIWLALLGCAALFDLYRKQL